MTKVFKSSAEMTLDDLTAIFDFLLGESALNYTGKKSICVSYEKIVHAPNFVSSMKGTKCFPESSIKELVDFAIEEHHQGNSVVVTCSDNQAGREACQSFNAEVAIRQSNLIDYQSSDAEL